MALTEAEIQVLASLAKAESEGASSARARLEDSGERFWVFREDWAGAFDSLSAKGLIAGDETGYRLTDAGRAPAHAYHRERPDSYWYYYQRFYPAARGSEAHSRLCERVFGRDLCQEGMTDMAALDHLLDLIDPKPGDRLLDLGCGAGMIAEHISDRTGATVTGIDYALPAIAEATERTAAKRDRLTFVTADLNALDLPERSFDAAISLDALYWVADLPETLARIARALKAGGRMGLFMLDGRDEDEPPETLAPANTGLGRALGDMGFAYEAYDYTESNAAFWRRNWQAATDMRDAFEAEGNGFIAASLIREAEEEFLPAIAAGTLCRYLYHVRL